jgi:hypothetical protein
MQHSDVTLGQQVRCDRRPGTFTVVKINPTNIKCQNNDTKGILNAHPSFLFPADATTGLGAANDPPVVETVPYIAPHKQGTVVRFKPGRKAPDGLWVIVRDSNDRAGRPTYSVHALGGSTLYYRGVGHAHLEVVTGDVTIPA